MRELLHLLGQRTLWASIVPVAFLFLGIPSFAFGADTFPRGAGFYFSVPKLLALLLVYICWVRTCTWVDKDSRSLGLTVDLWNGLLLAGAAVGLLIVWVLPFFLASFVLFVVLYLTPTLMYVSLRNQKVSEDDKVLTARHLKGLAESYLKLKFERENKEERRARPCASSERTSTSLTKTRPGLPAPLAQRATKRPWKWCSRGSKHEPPISTWNPRETT